MRRSNSVTTPRFEGALCGRTRRQEGRRRRGELRGARFWRTFGHAVDHGDASMPDLVFVLPRFDVHRAVSRQIHAIFAEYTALIEPLALDEAYLDVTENRRGLPTASVTAKEIRARILQETSLTASAGVSYNKFGSD
jgi:nucleotidyltransferase/DNA polymerase involved in DNA repair